MAEAKDIVSKLWSVRGCPDDPDGGVRVDVGLSEEDPMQVRWVGCAHKGALLRDLGDSTTGVIPDLLTIRVGSTQIMKLVNEDCPDALA